MVLGDHIESPRISGFPKNCCIFIPPKMARFLLSHRREETMASFRNLGIPRTQLHQPNQLTVIVIQPIQLQQKNHPKGIHKRGSESIQKTPKTEAFREVASPRKKTSRRVKGSTKNWSEKLVYCVSSLRKPMFLKHNFHIFSAVGF